MKMRIGFFSAASTFSGYTYPPRKSTNVPMPVSTADARARQYLARQMEQFLFSGAADQPTGYVPPSA